MKLLIEVTLKKNEGKTCDADDVFQCIEEALDGESYYPFAPDAEEESEYEVTLVSLKEGK